MSSSRFILRPGWVSVNVYQRKTVKLSFAPRKWALYTLLYTLYFMFFIHLMVIKVNSSLSRHWVAMALLFVGTYCVVCVFHHWSSLFIESLNVDVSVWVYVWGCGCVVLPTKRIQVTRCSRCHDDTESVPDPGDWAIEHPMLGRKKERLSFFYSTCIKCLFLPFFSFLSSFHPLFPLASFNQQWEKRNESSPTFLLLTAPSMTIKLETTVTGDENVLN